VSLSAKVAYLNPYRKGTKFRTDDVTVRQHECQLQPHVINVTFDTPYQTARPNIA